MPKSKIQFTATIILQDSAKCCTRQLVVDPDISDASPEMEALAWKSQAVRAAIHLMSVLEDAATNGTEI